MIHIEMSIAKRDHLLTSDWDLRVGGIDDCYFVHNATKEIVLEVIAKEMDTHMEAVIDK